MSSQVIPVVRLAGLERTAKLAGESFGHEDAAVMPRLSMVPSLSSRRLWFFATVLALAGFAVMALR